MRYQIIGVHGLNAKPEPKELEKGWRSAISEGLKINKQLRISPEDLNFHMCYWADIFHDEFREPNYEPAENESHLQRYKDRWYESVIATVADLGDGAIEFIKNRGLATDAADWFLKKKLDDLHYYYEDDDKRNRCRDCVLQALEKHKDETVVLVTHSMGTIISYDCARIMGNTIAAGDIDHFVTMGSPLGLPHVKSRIKREFKSTRTPSVVKKWTNFSDRRDPVCFDTHLKGDFSANKDKVKAEDDRVLNDWGISIGTNPLWKFHKSYGYLRTPEFSDLIADYI